MSRAYRALNTTGTRAGAVSSRVRGYEFENAIAKRYNKCGWRAWRLGSSSAGLPDILAVGRVAIHVHELKATTGGSVRIPAHQIGRCLEVASAFERYAGRVVLSARFVRKAEYHFIWDGEPEPVTINVRGKARGGELTPVSWEDLVDDGTAGGFDSYGSKHACTPNHFPM